MSLCRSLDLTNYVVPVYQNETRPELFRPLLIDFDGQTYVLAFATLSKAEDFLATIEFDESDDQNKKELTSLKVITTPSKFLDSLTQYRDIKLMVNPEVSESGKLKWLEYINR